MKMERRREGNLSCNDDGMKSTVRIYEQRSNKHAGYAASATLSPQHKSALRLTLRGRIMLYPNPTNDYCLINGLSSSGNLLIYDTKGTLYLQKINFEASVYTIYTANWPPGVYIIQYIDDSHTTNFKLIVQHI
jgi:hypothetical protein